MIIIREAIQTDSDAIAFVHVESWKTTYRGIMPDDVLENLSLVNRQKQWERIIREAQSYTIVAEIDQKVVAFANGGTPIKPVDGYDGELYSLYSLKEVQGKGIGRLLMQAFAKKLRQQGFPSLALWVASENQAVQFYEHLGGQFCQDGTLKVGDIEIPIGAYGWKNIEDLY